MNTKYAIKIPDTVSFFYNTKKNILTFKGPLSQKSFKLKIKITISKTNKLLKLTTLPFLKMSNHEKKKLKAIRKFTITLLKKLIIETNTIIYKKLNVVGVGYRIFKVDNFEEKLLLLKLGYSHPIYFRIPNNLKIFCLKFTKIFISGNSYEEILLTASLLKKNKLPEPYKGKGILYENEKILLKQGKKI